MSGVSLGLFAFGFILTFLGVLLRLGKLRWMYAGQSLPVYAQREVLHLGIPIGFINIFIALIVICNCTWAADTLVVLFFTTVILAIWQPWWLKPTWLRWLENKYGHVLEEMFAEARGMDRFNWARQVKTQADLERWADSVAEKHGWQRLGER